MSLDAVKDAVELFTEKSSEIREMIEGVQEVVFDTYAEIGRINADGKIEV
jgi:phosphoribosylaminoimidazole-succinocarboxamide synthase